MIRFAALMLFVSLPLWAGDHAGKQPYVLCAACHGPNGQGEKELDAPAIAGQEVWYLETQIKAFRSGVRGTHPQDKPGQTMTPLVATIDDSEVGDIAAYVSGLKPMKHPQTITGNVTRGKQLYGTCAACHGPKAEGMKVMNSPNLTLQQDWYLYRQLEYYQKGIRGTHEKDVLGKQMRPMAMTLSNDEDLRDVVAYIMSLAK